MIRVAFVVGDYPPEQLRLREDTERAFIHVKWELGSRLPAHRCNEF
jgi:hypothetical protein